MNLDISIILPVHQLDEVTTGMLLTAVKSVETQSVQPKEILIVVPAASEVGEFIKQADFGVVNNIIKVVENTGDTDFASQVNLGVSEASGTWISILEMDDEYANIWFKNVAEYMSAYPTVDLFMPIVIDVDMQGKFLGFTNEAVWANSFSDEMGILDLNALLNYQNFSVDGIVLKKEVFEENGGFKPSIKLTFLYEFLLRMAFRDVRIMTIPKFGYKHLNQRPDSLFANYKTSIDPVEARWWMAQAKKEYFFDKDRKITYGK